MVVGKRKGRGSDGSGLALMWAVGIRYWVRAKAVVVMVVGQGEGSDGGGSGRGE